jgi:hypothetical protein
MFELGCVNIKLKIKIWNLKSLCETFGIWKLKCLNLDVWIHKVENWKLKFEISLWNVWKESKILKIEMFEYLKLKTKNWNVWILKIEN